MCQNGHGITLYVFEISFAPYDTKGIFVPFNPLSVGKLE